MNHIEVFNLKKVFGRGKKKVIAVNDVSFKVKKGEIFGLLGVNGAGKTTTINMITGLLKKDSGTVQILGKNPEEEWEFVKNKTNVSTAYYPLSDVLTVRQNLKVYEKIYSVKDKRRIDELLEMFELKGLGNRRVMNLSSGEKTRTALCKGLLNNPEVLFLDECTVGLDPDIAEKTRRIIQNYHRQTGCTILFTSHYMYEVEELCDRIAFMKDGRIVRIATAQDLKKDIKEYVMEITVAENPKGLKKFLKDKGHEVSGIKGNTVTLKLYSPEKDIHDIIDKIMKKGFYMIDLHIKRPTLDDVFIEFARQKK